MTLLDVTGLKTRYGRIPALFGADLSITESEIVGVLGHNGMGKSTLLKTIMGLLPTVEGEILLDGLPVSALSPDKRARKGLGYVPQGRQIFATLSVMENLRMGCCLNPRPESEIIAEVLEVFPRLTRLLSRPGGALSGGEQQLLALARCLCAGPRLILLDEPTEGIQPSIIEEMIDTIRMLKTTHGITVLLVEQNLNFIGQLSDRVLILKRGRIVHEAPKDALRCVSALEDFAAEAM